MGYLAIITVHRPVISENGHLQRSPENDIQKSTSSIRNVREKKPMAPVKMSGNTNKLDILNGAIVFKLRTFLAELMDLWDVILRAPV